MKTWLPKICQSQKTTWFFCLFSRGYFLGVYTAVTTMYTYARNQLTVSPAIKRTPSRETEKRKRPKKNSVLTQYNSAFPLPFWCKILPFDIFEKKTYLLMSSPLLIPTALFSLCCQITTYAKKKKKLWSSPGNNLLRFSSQVLKSTLHPTSRALCTRNMRNRCTKKKYYCEDCSPRLLLIRQRRTMPPLIYFCTDEKKKKKSPATLMPHALKTSTERNRHTKCT